MSSFAQQIDLVPVQGDGLPNSLNLLQTSISELAALLDGGKITSVGLVKAYITSIQRDNVQGLGLQAIIQVAPIESVLKIAKSLDEERRNGNVRGPLHGIPILVKDSIATDPELGMNTSAGNTALEQSVVSGDAEVIKRLRAAGAIVLAKANLTEFSGYKGENVPLGWSAVGGPCTSPYITGGNLTGSSAGSAVGVCAGFGAVAVGAETAGSIVGPASRSALFGIRPTNDLLSNKGVVPVSSERDSVGPMGFTVADVAIVLDAMADNDGKYLRVAKSPQLHGLKIGLVRQDFMDDSEARFLRPGCFVDQCFSAILLATDKMREAGAVVMNVEMNLTASDINTFIDSQGFVLAGDFQADMTRYLEELKESPVRTLEELVQWNKDHAAEELPLMAPDQADLIGALTAPSRDSEEYRKASAQSSEIGGTRGFDHIFDKHDLDAAIIPMDFGHSSFLAGPKAYASGVAPLGIYENGVPFGLLFVVRPYQEEKLISVLSRYEEIMPKRITPKSLQR